MANGPEKKRIKCIKEVARVRQTATDLAPTQFKHFWRD